MPLDPHIPTDPPNKAANEEVLAELAEMNRAGRLVSLTVIGETADGYMSRYTLAQEAFGVCGFTQAVIGERLQSLLQAAQRPTPQEGDPADEEQ